MSGLRNAIVGILLFCTGGVALAATETVRDEFSSVSYSGNDGSQSWATDWQEIDSGSSPATGFIRVTGNELRIHGNTTSTNPLAQVRVQREVDLVAAGATSATLNFDWRIGSGFEPSDILFVEVSNDGGSNFGTIATLDADAIENAQGSNATGAFTQDISGFIASNTQIRFRVRDTRGGSEFFFLDNVEISYEVPPPVQPGEVAGTVYFDSNANGENNSDAGQAGITVTAYDLNGVAVATTVTDANGDYLIGGLDDAQSYRLEFTDIPTNLDPGPSGPDNNSTVVFVQSPQGDVDVGLTDAAGFCQANPTVATSQFINGNPLAGGSAAGRPSLHLFDYDESGTSGFSTGATSVQTGSTWGLAYQRETKQLFSSAVLKRHAGLGPDGLDAIYIRDMDTGVTSLYANVSTLGMDVGTISSNGSRGLPSDAGSPSTDAEAFAKVAKTGIGDIDLSGDGATMYLSNLNDRQIYSIPVGNPAAAPGAASPLPNQPWLAAGTCTDGLARPWGLKNNAGKLYVGVVCTGETLADDTVLANTPPSPVSLRAMVYEFDPAGNSWTKPLDFPLDYRKGQTSTVRHGSTLDRFWLPWTDRYVNDTITGRNQGVSANATYLVDTTRTSRPMPILSDIEFDSTGSMILGFMDRGGMMFGNGNFPPNGSTSPLHQYNVSGDLLRACPAGVGWTLESGGACGGVTGAGTNAQGPGGGEFYDGDNFSIHEETIMGGIAQHPGTDEITVLTMDPLTSVDAGGVKWISNTTGSATRGLQLYQGGPNTPNNGTFGKGVGLGDIEILCDPAPLEIGNYVWVDTNQDGIQDPNEAPIPNITIELWEDTTGDGVGDTQVGTAVTDANGNYYFGGANDNNMTTGSLKPVTNYEIRLPLSDPDIPANHVPTTQDQGTDLHDSDGDNGGINPGHSTISLTTGGAGENNHTYDFGLSPPTFDLALDKVLATGQATTITAGDPVLFTITVYNQGTVNAFDIDINDYIPADTSYSAINSTADATVLTTANGGSATLANNDDGTFEISELTAGDNVSFDIELDVSPGFSGTFVRNWAEISDGSNTDGGATTTDIDSTPDSIQFDSAGETDDLDDDNVIDEDAKNGVGDPDEDDHDPAEVTVIPGQFDLALQKVLATGQAATVNPGDKVAFTVTVFNQGNVPAFDIDVNDYLPANTTYSVAGSTPSATLTTANAAGTGFINNNDGTFTIDELAPGDNVSFDIALDIDGNFTGTSIRNWAEISDGTDTDGGGTTTDIDSTPDATNFNQPEETDDLDDDNIIDEDGKNGGDEDDHDPAEVTVTQVFDLALQKVLAAGQASAISAGDPVLFTITVHNQGTLPAFDVDVTDYIPVNTAYSAMNSSPSGNLTSANGATVVLTNNANGTFEISELAQGDNVSFDIELDTTGFTDTSLRNWTEISGGSLTDNGPIAVDIDSVPDAINFNNPGETDDLIDDNRITESGKAGGDEDDHDPAEVTVGQSFDLALQKILAAGQATTINPGDPVIYTITVHNQGTLPAFDIDVIDYIPTDMTYTAAGSTPTGGGITNNDDGTFMIDTLAAGANVSFDIALALDAGFQGSTIRNWAEISDATETDGGTTTTDDDSTPNNSNFNDPGETDDLDDDNELDGNGKAGGDEDDHDPAEVNVNQTFDLALSKVLTTATLVNPGDDVVFTVTVENQGSLDAFDIDVMDYIPADMTYTAAGSTPTGGNFTNNGDGTFEIAQLAAGTNTTIDIGLTVNADFQGTTIRNWAEISDGTDTDGGTTTTDIDSTPDGINFNQPGETDDLADDDVTDQDGKNGGDEDDHDPAEVIVTQIFDLALDKKLAASQVTTIVAGDPVLFTITVYNQGTADAFDIDVIDYIPANTAYSVTNSSATGDLTTTNGATVTLTNPDDGTFEISELAAGDDVSFDIELSTEGTFTGSNITNWAEISDATDTDGGVTTADIDSTPDTTQFNGGGETDDLNDDDIIDEDGNNGGDEDDHDPALVIVTPKPVSIGSYIWEDTNIDGMQQVGEPAIAGAEVTLVDSLGNQVTDLSGALVGPQTTGPNGTYLFDNLPEGDYRVRVQPPAIYKKTPAQNVNDNEDIEGDSNIATDVTPGVLYESGLFSLAPETEPTETNNEVGDDQDNAPGAIADDASGNMTVDFGFVKLVPAITIEKSTNAEDADVAPGPTITVGDAITWEYLIENTGEVDLTPVTVTDDQLTVADISCPVDNNDNVIDTLAIGAIVTCTATSVATAGAYVNTGSVTGTPPDPQLPPPTDDDPSNHFGGSSSIDIEKATNGEDADTAPGPTIDVTGAVTWTYMVENTGNVDLANVTVTDDQLVAADISCDAHLADLGGDNIIVLMNPGDIVSCTATGVAEAGQYTNNSSVTGTPPVGTPPSDNDPSNYFGGSASIDIEKATNTEDADTVPGPTINIGDAVTWTYVVENTGNVVLTNVTVTDDQLAPTDISCPVDNGDNVIASMAAGQVVNCTASGVAVAGQYTNNASVTGTPPVGTPPTDNDPSHYFGGSSSIDIEKATNGDDADTEPGPTINVNDPVTWTYRVENTGNVLLTDVTVTDDQLTAADIACPVDDGDNVIGQMAPGQVVSCTATGISVAEQYTNNASVTGTPPAGPPPSDNDPSHYFGGSSSIDIEKSTNGDDADVTPGPTISVNDTVTWTYRVENTGNVELTDVTVTDDQLAAADISCPVDDNDNIIASMAAGQVILCTATGIAVAGQYTNNASVTGTPPVGPPPSDDDPSHYFGGSSTIDIEKATDGEDADAAPGPTINVGDTVTWTYRVENTGNVELTDVTVTDDQLAATDISCPVDNNDNVIASMTAGQVIQCTATSVATTGQYTNNASVTGTPPAGPPPSDNDLSHYFGGSSSIDIEKSTNGQDADVVPGPTIAVDDTVTWSYRVENTGNVELAEVIVTDDQLAASEISCAADDNDNVIDSLAPSQVVLCTATGISIEGQYQNSSSVVGTPPGSNPPPVTDDDPSHYFGGSSSIDIEKATNGEDADVLPGPTISVSDVVTWTYSVENTGNVDLTDVSVTDDQLDQTIAGEEIICAVNDGSILNVIPTLTVGQTVLCSATGVAVAGQYANIANVTGTPPPGGGTPPTDNDPSHYFGGDSSIDIEKATNGDDADATPGPTIAIDDTVTWTYRVENTGNVVLSNVTVTDDQLAPADINCPVDDGDNIIASMAAGQVVNCTANGIAAAGQYTNNASVTGTPPPGGGTPPSDDDPSHYFGGDSAIDIEKSTNGEDADTDTGPTISVGDSVTWTYRVENTGNVPLVNVVVTDDQLTPADISCAADDADNVIAQLAVAQVVLCTANGIALVGQYSNNGSVTGTPPVGSPPSDDDPSHYFGGSSSIDIEKSTNGEDADATPGPTIAVGDPVSWSYTVENTGNVDLSNVTVVDDQGEAISCPVADSTPDDNIIDTLAVGQTVVCSGGGIAQANQYANGATVTGTPPTGPPTTDNDPSHYFGATSSIALEKDTNGEDADAAPGPNIPVGDPVTWTYRVTNTGTSTLLNIEVTDDQLDQAVAGEEITCAVNDGTALNVIPSLAVDQTVLCSAMGVAEILQYANTGLVVGTPDVPNAPLVTGDDPSHYFGAASGLSLEKSTNGTDADLTPGPTIEVGDVVTWTYLVENTGNVSLSAVTVTDDQLPDTDIICPTDDASDNIIDSLAVGQSVSCTATGVAQADQYANIGTVTGIPLVGIPPLDTDPSHYFGASSSIDIEKLTNSIDADIEPGPTISIGDVVTWSYGVTNTGNVDLTAVTVTDDKVATAQIACPVDDGDNVIDTLGIGQTVVCTATGISVPGQYDNTATVTGTPPSGPPPSDNDMSHYFGADEKVLIEKSTNGEDADAAPGPSILEGNTVTWSYRVTNTGNVRLDNVGVTDDMLAPASIVCLANNGTSNVIAAMTPGQSVVCTASDAAVDGPYENMSSVVGMPVDEDGMPLMLPDPTDDDPSHYNGFQPFVHIGSTVFEDPNNNGLQDPTEVGIDGVTLQLFAAGDPPTGMPIAETTSAGGGDYIFADLPEGTYYVYIPTPPVGLELSSVPTSDADNQVDGDDNGAQPLGSGMPVRSPDIELLVNQEPSMQETFQGGDQDDTLGDFSGDMTIDFGFLAPPLNNGTIGDRIYFDENNNKTPEADEGISGVTVNLFDQNGMLVQTTTTDQSGNYLFTNLPVETNYTVRVDTTTLPGGGSGWGNSVDPDTPTPNTGDVGDSESTLFLSTASPVNLAQDFGYIGGPNSLSGTIWRDDNNDGVQDTGEPPLPNVTVELRDPVTLEVIQKTTTDSNGDYQFVNLPDGRFTNVVTDENGVTAGLEHTQGTPGQDGTSQAIDGSYVVDLDPTSVLAAGVAATDPTSDFGFFDVTTIPITLGSFVSTAGLNGEVEFIWTTQSEIANAGFMIYQKVDGQWLAVNETIIPAKGESIQLQRYRYLGQQVESTEFVLVDVDVRGKQILHGPFALGERFGAVDKPAQLKSSSSALRIEQAESRESIRKRAAKRGFKARLDSYLQR